MPQGDTQSVAGIKTKDTTVFSRYVARSSPALTDLRMFKYLGIVALLGAVPVGTLAAEFVDYIVQPDEYVDGQPVTEYTASWWQWTYTMPPELSPVRDTTGEYCDVGQRGEVWFLAGGYGSSTIQRECTIPADKHLFFPVINMLYYPNREGGITCDRARKSAALNNDKLLDIVIEINGVKAWNPAASRMSTTACFDLLGMLPDEYNAPYVYPSATDGYWIMLKPLSRGRHSLKFSARYGRENGAFGKMAQDIEYTLIVE